MEFFEVKNTAILAKARGLLYQGYLASHPAKSKASQDFDIETLQRRTNPPALMLLTRSLTLPFLLPSWEARQLAHKLQRACMSDSAPGNALKIRKVIRRQPKPPKAASPSQLSLFDELFPEETESWKDIEAKLEKLPPFQFDGSFERKATRIQERPPLVEKPTDSKYQYASGLSTTTAHTERDDGKRRREAAVLVLNSASKRLEESDFFRIGHKGIHIQGWTTGIIKGMDFTSSQFPVTLFGC